MLSCVYAAAGLPWLLIRKTGIHMAVRAGYGGDFRNLHLASLKVALFFFNCFYFYNLKQCQHNFQEAMMPQWENLSKNQWFWNQMLDAIKCCKEGCTIAWNNMLKSELWSGKQGKWDNGFISSNNNGNNNGKLKGEKSGYLVTRCTLPRNPSTSGL